MKVKITGRAMVITSELKTEEIQKLQKFAPDTLFLHNDKGQKTFGVATSITGSVTPAGVSFNDTDADGKACITCMLPTSVDNEKKAEHVENAYGIILYDLGQLEASAKTAYERLKSKFAAVSANITLA